MAIVATVDLSIRAMGPQDTTTSVSGTFQVGEEEANSAGGQK